MVAKLPTWNGSKETWPLWYMQLQAYAGLMRFGQAVTGTKEDDLPSTETESADDTEEEVAARRRNMQAIYAFTMAFDGTTAMTFLLKAKSKEWPSGEAWRVIDSIKKRYQPKDTFAAIQFKTITEGEFVAGCDGIQDALLAVQVLESMDLKVKYPIVWKCDNKGAIDLLNSWSATGRTRHIANKITWMRELKEEGKLVGEWVSNKEMFSDIFTKNVGGTDYDRHKSQFVD